MATMFTYVIGSRDLATVKIGRSVHPIKRLSSLQTAHAESLKLMAVIEGDMESQIHERCKCFRMSGEWFRYTIDVRSILMSFGFKKLPPATCEIVRAQVPVVADYLYEAEQYAGRDVRETHETDDIAKEIREAIYDREMYRWVTRDIEEFYVPEQTCESSYEYADEVHCDEYGVCPLEGWGWEISESECLVGYSRVETEQCTWLLVFFTDPYSAAFKRRIIQQCVDAAFWSDQCDDIGLKFLFFNEQTRAYDVVAEG